MIRLIGIDPSFNNFGMAVYEGGKFTELRTADFLQQVNYIQEKGFFKDSVFVMEDPNEDSAVFGALAKLKAARRSDSNSFQSICRTSLKIAQDIGRNKACADLFIQMLQREGAPYITVKPSVRHRADKDKVKQNLFMVKMLTMPTKTNAAQFEFLTGYKGQSNEHSRDAATLVWDKTQSWVDYQLKIQSNGKKG